MPDIVSFEELTVERLRHLERIEKAAAALVNDSVGEAFDSSRDYWHCVSCPDFYKGEEYPAGQPVQYVERSHAPDCRWQALVSALGRGG